MVVEIGGQTELSILRAAIFLVHFKSQDLAFLCVTICDFQRKKFDSINKGRIFRIILRQLFIFASNFIIIFNTLDLYRIIDVI